MGRSIASVLLAAALGGCTGSGTPSGPASPTPGATRASTAYNIPYASAASLQVLDIYLPAWTPEPAPLVIWVHGGGWRTGDKKSVAARYDPSAPVPAATACTQVVQVQAPDVAALNAKGYAVAAINYRLNRDTVAAVQDAKAAVRFLRANATSYHLDPERFAAWGDSAGGYTVIMLGVTGGEKTKFDDAALGNPEVSADVQAVVDWFGPTDSNMPGNPGPEDSPYTYIKSGKTLPPFIIAHGDADCVVPVDHSRRLHAAITGAGGQATLTVLPGAQHEDPVFMRTQLAPTFEFLDRAFGR